MGHCVGAIAGKKNEKKICPKCGRKLEAKKQNGWGNDSQEVCPNPDCDPFKKISGRSGFGDM